MGSMRFAVLGAATLLTLSLAAAGAQGQEAVDGEPSGSVLTLDAAIRLAMEQNASLASATAGVEAMSAAQQLAERLRGPSIRVEAGYQQSNNPVLVFGSKLLQENFGQADFGLDALNRPSAYEDWATRLVAEQPLWTGGRLAAAGDAATAAARAAEAQRERARQEVVRRVVETYTGVLLAQEAVDATASALESAAENARLVSDRYEAGLVVESDLLLARVRQGEVEELLARARAERAVAEAAFNMTLGRPQETPAALAPLKSEAGVEEPPGSLIARAIDRRPDLLAARQQEEAMAAQLRVARAAHKPEIGLSASVEAHGEDFFGADGDNATIGVGLRWSLFESGRKKAQVLEAEAKAREATARTTLLKQQVELEVRQELALVDSASARFELAQKSIELARSSLALVEDRYENGLTTLVELLEAESSLTSARLRQVQSRRELALARAALDLATGDL